MDALPPLEFTLDGLTLKQVRAVLRHQQERQARRALREAPPGQGRPQGAPRPLAGEDGR